MFWKTSICSFFYDLIDVFMFPDEDINKIYEKYNIIKCFLYQNLTETDRTSIFFVFICEVACSVEGKSARNIIFEVLKKLKVLEKLGLSYDFWE